MTRCQSCKTRHGCFGYPGEPPVSCAAHKAEGMVDVVHPRCRSADCSKRPSFGPPGAKPLACAAHRSPDWIDLKNKRTYHRRCEADGCELIPVFGFPNQAGSKGAVRCATHRLEGQVDVIHPRCQQPGCTLRPSFAFWPTTSEAGGGSKKPVRCREHKLPGMVDTKNRRCDEPSCSKKRLAGMRTCRSHTSALLVEASGQAASSVKSGMKRSRSTSISENMLEASPNDNQIIRVDRNGDQDTSSPSRRLPQATDVTQFTFPVSWMEALSGNGTGSSCNGGPIMSHPCSPQPTLTGFVGGDEVTKARVSYSPLGGDMTLATGIATGVQGMVIPCPPVSDPVGPEVGSALRGGQSFIPSTAGHAPISVPVPSRQQLPANGLLPTNPIWGFVGTSPASVAATGPRPDDDLQQQMGLSAGMCDTLADDEPRFGNISYCPGLIPQTVGFRSADVHGIQSPVNRIGGDSMLYNGIDNVSSGGVAAFVGGIDIFESGGPSPITLSGSASGLEIGSRPVPSAVVHDEMLM